jgi:hypothetical protein
LKTNPDATSRAAEDDKLAPDGIFEQMYPFQPICTDSGLNINEPTPWINFPQSGVVIGSLSKEKVVDPKLSETILISLVDDGEAAITVSNGKPMGNTNPLL